MAVAQKGFLLFLEHQAVVYGVLAKLSIRPHHSYFQDWRDEGILVYLNYFDRYRDPLTDAAAITKFNKLAWRFVFLTLMQRMQKGPPSAGSGRSTGQCGSVADDHRGDSTYQLVAVSGGEAAVAATRSHFDASRTEGFATAISWFS